MQIIGGVSYLNAKPLVNWFDTPEGAQAAQVTLEVPSLLAKQLRAREISAALLSSFESFQRADTVIAPGISISDFGRVKSVRLFSKVPFEGLKRVALDQSSLTSNALLQILLAELYDVKPFYEPRPPVLGAMLDEFDAGLLIGDPGMRASGEGLHVLDLGEAWHRLTGLPFVWAVWLMNEEQATPDLVESLQSAQTWGLARIEEIAASEAKRLAWPEEVCLDYLQNVIDFHLTARHLEGLRAYQGYCHRHGLISALNPLRIADDPSSRANAQPQAS